MPTTTKSKPAAPPANDNGTSPRDPRQGPAQPPDLGKFVDKTA
jgi:hypothetical protein